MKSKTNQNPVTANQQKARPDYSTPLLNFSSEEFLQSEVICELFRDFQPELSQPSEEHRKTHALINRLLFQPDDIESQFVLNKSLEPSLYSALVGLQQLILEKKLVTFKQIDQEMKIRKQQFLARLDPCDCMDDVVRQTTNQSKNAFPQGDESFN
ncbi:MAG: hypothetical protein MRY78_13420 [Saprospiraceae bacterium]|nr:hypothetical protein [Saprospiraceae bacterium]